MASPDVRSELVDRAPPDESEDARWSRRGTWAVLVTAVSVFVALTVGAAVANGPFAFDVHVAEQVARVRPAWLTSTMAVVTWSGSSVAVVTVVLLAAAMGARARDFRAAGLLAATSAAAWSASQLVKVLIARPRPGTSLVAGSFSNYAFPSGHATTSAVLWGMTAWLVARSWGRRARVPMISAWVAAMVIVDASRVELGAHWLSDVIAGSALGTAVLAASVLICTRPRSCPEDYLRTPN